MTKDKKITKVFVPVFCSVITLIGGFLGGKTYETHQNSAININIMNTLNDGSTEVNADTDLKTSTTNLIDAYMNEKDENQSQLQQIDSLKNNYNQAKKELETMQTTNEKLQVANNTLQGENKELQETNENLNAENEKLKAILLRDNTYAENIDDIVPVKDTFDRLENLDINDSVNYTQVDVIKDYHGDYHSVSYKLSAYDIAFVEYKLAKKYDVVNANIVTTLETGPDAHFSLEVYLDDQFLKRIDDITRDINLIPLGPIVVRGVDRLRIKVIKMEGDYWNDAVCYITDDSLSIVQ